VLLLHHNAGAISVVDSNGNTALHWAALNGHDSVSFLLSCIHKSLLKKFITRNFGKHYKPSASYMPKCYL